MCSTSSLILDDPSKPVDSTPYMKLNGGQQYLSITRPDVSYAVNRLSQFMNRPRETHRSALKKVLRYLKGTIHLGLFLHKHAHLKLSAQIPWLGSHQNKNLFLDHPLK